MKLQLITEYLETYSGRDRIMRVLYYSSQLIAGLTRSKEFQIKLDIFSDQINSCRTVLRLFDDGPMLHYTMSYGMGREDPDRFMRICAFAVNIFDQIYYPLEHIAWAADCKLLPIRSEPWWTASSFCWALSMYLMVMKSLRYYLLLRNLKNLIRPGQLNSGYESYSNETNYVQSKTSLRTTTQLYAHITIQEISYSRACLVLYPYYFANIDSKINAQFDGFGIDVVFITSKLM